MFTRKDMDVSISQKVLTELIFFKEIISFTKIKKELVQKDDLIQILLDRKLADS